MQLLLTLVGVCSLWRTFGQTADTNPVRKVVTLLEDMKAQVEKEAKEDANANENFMCWCKTNKNEKNAAVEAAQAKISELEAFIEKAAGLEAQLKTEIEALESDIAEDQDSLATATALKDKETAEYKTTSADLKECIAALKEALAVLAKVQLLQKSGHKVEVKPLLVQVKQTLSAMKLSPAFGGFRGVMQRDMWDMLSSIDAASGVTGSFLPRGHTMSTLEQKGQINLDQPIGNAAGAKSYNSRSGSIVGILSEMHMSLREILQLLTSGSWKQLCHSRSSELPSLLRLPVLPHRRRQNQLCLLKLKPRLHKQKKISLLPATLCLQTRSSWWIWKRLAPQPQMTMMPV